MFDNKIADLKAEIIRYTGIVQGMVEKSVTGLVGKDKIRLHEVMEKDEPLSNDMELLLDKMCVTMIAQYEPKAKDLRTILMVYTMSTDLERIADHAVNIAENGLFLIKRPQVKPLIDIPRMADMAVNMVRDGARAFIEEDALLARAVCERDHLVDGLMEQILRELVTFMSQNPKIIERAIHLLSIARNLERIADLSTNICEDVIFMVEGKVIKHRRPEKI